MSYEECLGKTTDRSDSMALEPLLRYEAMLDRDPAGVGNGTELPPCAHWIYFNSADKHSDIAEDGHAVTIVSPDPLIGKELQRTTADVPLRRILRKLDVNWLLEVSTYHVPTPGRQTARSSRPSPS